MPSQERDKALEESLRYLSSGIFSDFTIRLEEKEWKTHRAVIAVLSAFFRSACEKGFKEGIHQSITVHDDDPQIFARLLIFLYAGDYPSNDLSGAMFKTLTELNPTLTSMGTLTIHASMYGIGDKYDVPALKSLSRDRFIRKIKIAYAVEDFLKAIEVVYDTTPDSDQELRKWVVWEAQRQQPVLRVLPEFEVLMKSIVDFAWDCAMRYGRLVDLWCTACQDFDSFDFSIVCTCGFSGMCERTAYCTNPNFPNWQCGMCWVKGSLQPASTLEGKMDTVSAVMKERKRKMNMTH